MDDESKYALEAWEAVVTGSSSMVDWFDTSTRRFIVTRPNPPGRHDPRGLTSLERAVAHHAARGDANKVIAHRLGLSSTRVSSLLQSSLRKLGLRSKAQLVYCVRGLGLPVSVRGPTLHQPRLRKSA